MKERIEKYMIDFLEVPHESFSGLPPCPFARKERLEKRIVYKEGSIGEESPNVGLMESIEHLAKEENPRTLIYFDVQVMSSVQQAYRFAQEIIDSCVTLNILAIPIHPDDDYQINGVRTRGEAPTVFLLIQVRKQVTIAKEKLLRTSYYEKNGDHEERRVQTFSDILREKTGAEIVTVWWKEHVLRSVQRGEKFPEPVVGLTMDVLDRNGVYRWLKRFGTMYGWIPLCRFQENEPLLEEACREGEIVICAGFGGAEHGHLSMLLWNEEKQTIFHEGTGTQILKNMLAQCCWIWRP